MKNVLLQSIVCVLMTYSCISVDLKTLPPERLESQPIRSDTIKGKQEFYFSDKQIIKDGNEKKILLTISKRYEVTANNYYKVKYVTEKKIIHDFLSPMIPIVKGWERTIKPVKEIGILNCDNDKPRPPDFNVCIPLELFAFPFLILAEFIAYAPIPIWYPLQYAFVGNLRNSERLDEIQEKTFEEKNEIIPFDYDSNSRNVKVNESSYDDNGKTIINTKPFKFKDNSIELKIKDLLDIKKHKNTSVTKYYNVVFDVTGEEYPTQLNFILNQSDKGNLKIE